MGKLLIVHRSYRIRGGEDVFLHQILIPHLNQLEIKFELLELSPFSLREAIIMALGLEKLRPSYRIFKNKLNTGNFTAALFNNFVPTVSLSASRLAKHLGLSTYAWLHNMRFTCANGLIFNGKTKCEKCSTSGSHWAFLQNCHCNWLQSLLYSWVYRKNRIKRKVTPFIDHFICNSEFTKQNFCRFNQDIKNKTDVVRMPLPSSDDNSHIDDYSYPKPFFLYVGRLSYEKGIDQLVDLASRYSQFTFVVVGNGSKKYLEKLCLNNIIHKQFVNSSEKSWLFSNAAAVIVPSRVQETYSLVVLEAAASGTPVAYPVGGGAEETFRFLGCKGVPFEQFQPLDWVSKKSYSSTEKIIEIEDNFTQKLKEWWA